jgi:pyridoxamine 5'-phosphate oxidase family protein
LSRPPSNCRAAAFGRGWCNDERERVDRLHDSAALDDGRMWTNAWAITELTADETHRIAELTRRAVRLKSTDRETEPMTILTSSELEYLASQRLGRIATAQPNGTLQVSPVGFTWNAELETVDVSGYGMASSRKYRNVADNGRVAFVVDDVESVKPWRPRCLEIRGRAEVVPDSADGPLIRIRPARIISFGIDVPFAGPHNLTVNARDVNQETDA